MIRVSSAACVAVALGVAGAAAPLPAQERPPSRPRLSRDADTNDAMAYYRLGMERLRQRPRDAVAAFYWAERLDPGSPPNAYARSVAALLTMPGRLVGYVRREPGTLTHPDVVHADSLLHRALIGDPFVHRTLAHVVVIEYGRRFERRDEWVMRQDVPEFELVSNMMRYFASSNPFLAGVMSYARGDYSQALTYYRQALSFNTPPDLVHFERALAYYHMVEPDSAAAALATAIEALRATPDAPRPRHESVQHWEYALGYLHEQRGDYPTARQAYERALAADPGYLPARLRHGAIVVRAGDTAALSGLESLVAERGDYAPHVFLGGVLGELGRTEAAARQLRRAAELEPWAAAPWFLMGRLLEFAADSSGAVAAYERYAALAARSDPNLEAVTAKLSALRRGGP